MNTNGPLHDNITLAGKTYSVFASQGAIGRVYGGPDDRHDKGGNSDFADLLLIEFDRRFELICDEERVWPSRDRAVAMMMDIAVFDVGHRVTLTGIKISDNAPTTARELEGLATRIEDTVLDESWRSGLVFRAVTAAAQQ